MEENVDNKLTELLNAIQSLYADRQGVHLPPDDENFEVQKRQQMTIYNSVHM